MYMFKCVGGAIVVLLGHYISLATCTKWLNNETFKLVFEKIIIWEISYPFKLVFEKIIIWEISYPQSQL